jgi:hypothetical protein
MRSAKFILFLRYYYNNEIEEDEKGGAVRVHGNMKDA